MSYSRYLGGALLFFSINSMDVPLVYEYPTKIPVLHSWENSHEQRCCCRLCSVASLIAEVYIFLRMTPTEQKPIVAGFFGSQELAPDREQLCLLGPMACVFACARINPDHSCCLGKTRLCTNAIKRTCCSFGSIFNTEKVKDKVIFSDDDCPGVMIMESIGDPNKKED